MFILLNLDGLKILENKEQKVKQMYESFFKTFEKSQMTCILFSKLNIITQENPKIVYITHTQKKQNRSVRNII